MEQMYTPSPGVGSAAPPAPPTAPSVPPAALSTVWAVPVPPQMKKEIRARRGKSSLIFSVLVALLVVVMFLNGIYAKPDGSFSPEGFYGAVLALATAGLWKLAVFFIDGNTPKPMSIDSWRVNEVYEQGVMSTSETRRVILAFDEVTSFVETENWLALYSKNGEIVWLADDLTPAAAGTLMTALAARLPQTVFTRKSPLVPRKRMEAAPPPAMSFGTPLETLPARFSAKGATVRGFAALLKRGAPLFFLVSMALANVLCDSFLDVGTIVRASVDHFATQTDLATVFTSLFLRFWLMMGGSLVCAGLGFLLVAWEQTAATNAQNRNGVCVHLLADGIRVQDGAEFTVLPRGGFHTARDKNGTVCVPLGNRVLTVAYPDFCRSLRAQDLFKP